MHPKVFSRYRTISSSHKDVGRSCQYYILLKKKFQLLVSEPSIVVKL
nr:MAG TPA: hypothetical protein [Bacteriophage sp.]